MVYQKTRNPNWRYEVYIYITLIKIKKPEVNKMASVQSERYAAFDVKSTDAILVMRTAWLRKKEKKNNESNFHLTLCVIRSDVLDSVDIQSHVMKALNCATLRRDKFFRIRRWHPVPPKLGGTGRVSVDCWSFTVVYKTSSVDVVLRGAQKRDTTLPAVNSSTI